jgi:hypothetical protein
MEKNMISEKLEVTLHYLNRYGGVDAITLYDVSPSKLMELKTDSSWIALHRTEGLITCWEPFRHEAPEIIQMIMDHYTELEKIRWEEICIEYDAGTLPIEYYKSRDINT